jgi:hypothetical protein
MNKNVKRDIGSMKKKRKQNLSVEDITKIKAKDDDLGEQTWEVAIFEYFMDNPIKYLIIDVADQWIAAKIAVNHLSRKFFKEKNLDNCYFIDDMANHPNHSQYLDEDLEYYEQNEFVTDNGRVLKTEQIYVEQVK